DVAGNQEHTTSQSTIIGAGYACSGPSPSFSMPAHGTLLMTGAAASNGQSYPFSANIPF
ncbi:MAG: hypothetical protein JOY61_04430, partial [Chloroflexi bacterium]|nr:hypothetical protein [Chloroflexota bacterium]